MSTPQTMSTETLDEVLCYHCKQPCRDVTWWDDKAFCCDGCRTVFQILADNNLCEYYSLSDKPGTSPFSYDEAFEYLDEPTIRRKVVEFDSPSFARIRFFVPTIHCISCIWLLENLRKIEPGVLKSEVNFSSRRICIDFDPELATPGGLAGRLASLGYAPIISLDTEKKIESGIDKPLISKLAIAGFAFGNIMLLSFPEYLGLGDSSNTLRNLFSSLILLLAVPVIVFSARDYFINAWKSFSQKQINIDVPIALGLLALFSRSVYDIASQTGPGYLDSLTGLVFFLLIGRWFQGKTYDTLAFDRDYKSYFPLAVQKSTGEGWSPVVIYDLEAGDRIKVRNLEIVPADSNLLSDRARIDYSFVTGESKPVDVSQNALVYAGGRIIGEPVQLRVASKTSQGHLTGLWNNPIFRKPEERGYKKIIDTAAKRFTWVVLFIALVTTIGWYLYDPSRVWLVLTSVLIVSCPCALALAAPFTYGSFMRVFGTNQLYLKNADVVERMAQVDVVVFDKTGTVTYSKEPLVNFVGSLSTKEASWVKALTSYSTHPLSSLISRSIHAKATVATFDFKEFPGRGVEGRIEGHFIRIGSGIFAGRNQPSNRGSTSVFVSVDGDIKGHFAIAIATRKNLKQMLDRLGDRCVAMISGDNEAEKENMKAFFRPGTQLLFNQSPGDKLHFIKELQQQGKKVMMVGDGLNDAGALRQSDVGIAVTDDSGVFTPACDGILTGSALESLDRLLLLARYSSPVLKLSFAISFLYNAIALVVAGTGHLSPLVAAVLMPVSSISVVVFSTLAVKFVSSKHIFATAFKKPA